jgi:predicted MFS family arabinose efflux permease
LLLALLFLPGDGQGTRQRNLDWLGLALLSPGLALFLCGAERVGQTIGSVMFVTGIAMMAAFLWTARRKGDDALIDLRLFKGKAFSAASVTQFLSNGAMFAGQMLIPAFLIQACGRAPGEMGWMLMPLGLGMMITNPFMGMLTGRFGLRRVSVGGALLALSATLPLLCLAIGGLNLFVFLPALFFRGMGQVSVGLPSMTAAYASVHKRNLPMATTSLNIVQRLGGPTMTTLCASFLAWKLGSHAAGPAVSGAFAWAFLLLSGLHGLTLLAAIRLPLRREDVAVDEEGNRIKDAGGEERLR